MIKFQVKSRDGYEQIEINTEQKYYRFVKADQRDMTGDYVDLSHHADMINLENQLRTNGFRVRIVL